jgi:hypothetical protein
MSAVRLCARAGAATALLLVGVSCGGDPCGTELIHETLSQDGKVKAVLFLRNCGATTDYVTSVSLVSPSENLTDDSTFFTPRRLGTIFRAKGVVPASVAWRSPSELIITYARGAEVLLRQHVHGKIRVAYEETPQPTPVRKDRD